MKLLSILAVVLFLTFIEVTNGTKYKNFPHKGKLYKLGYGCHRGYCWSYCGHSWVSFCYLFILSAFYTVEFFNQKNLFALTDHRTRWSVKN